MKVLAVSEVSGYMVGGPVTAAVELLAGLAKRGHAVTLVNDRAYPGSERFIRHYPASLPVRAEFTSVLTSAIAETKPDVIHVLAMGQRGLRRLRPVLDGQPWVVTIHSISPYERILPALHRWESVHYLGRGLRFGVN